MILIETTEERKFELSLNEKEVRMLKDYFDVTEVIKTDHVATLGEEYASELDHMGYQLYRDLKEIIGDAE